VSGSPARYRIVAFEGGFHARTLATIAAGGRPKYLEGFGPPAAEFDIVPAISTRSQEPATPKQRRFCSSRSREKAVFAAWVCTISSALARSATAKALS
jgi:adenosylmethionine-8-amino-7-oxononanoate aminotransferase